MLDMDGDGILSHKEFIKVLQKDEELCRVLSRIFGVSKHGKKYLDKKETARVWEQLDRDMDDHLSLLVEEMLVKCRDAPHRRR